VLLQENEDLEKRLSLSVLIEGLMKSRKGKSMIEQKVEARLANWGGNHQGLFVWFPLPLEMRALLCARCREGISLKRVLQPALGIRGKISVTFLYLLFIYISLKYSSCQGAMYWGNMF